MMKKVKIFTDGGARGNPGPAGTGFAIFDEAGEMIEGRGRYLGVATNNQAEYEAVIDAFEYAKKHRVTHIDLFADSKLIVEQLNRRFRVKDKKLAVLFVKAYNRSLEFESVRYTHIPREKNKVADAFANQAMDEGTKGAVAGEKEEEKPRKKT